MKLNGKTAGIRREPIVFPRDSGNIVLWAEAQASFKPFNEMCPMPEPPEYKQPGNKGTIKDVNDPAYLQAMEKRSEIFTHWLVVASISNTPELEWEQVKLTGNMAFKTWEKWQEELRDFGLCELEIVRVLNMVTKVNALGSEELDEAVESFLAESAQANQQNTGSFPSGAAPSTASGESAKK